jgi:pimeloyl-ACP methyl ester carboxylesterase
MGKTKRLVRSFWRLLLPVVLLVVFAVISSAIWLVHQMSVAPKAVYLVTPQQYGQLSSRGAQITDETWSNADGTQSRGWLLRGAPGAPAVILLHAYGADRSYLLNLGVKLNEATDFTVLMTDQRGHGDNPIVRFSSLGGAESEDVLAAVKFLRGIKIGEQTSLVGKDIGFYGTEMGALVASFAATKDESIKALVLDSVPNNSDDLLRTAIGKRYPFASFLTSRIARLGTQLYFFKGEYRNESVCGAAKELNNRQVLLLAGADNTNLQVSTIALNRCFPNSSKIESKTDLNPSGYNITNASLEQSEAYDRRVIDFFKQTLSPIVQTPDAVVEPQTAVDQNQ